MTKKILLTLTVLLLVITGAIAQIVNPVRWTGSVVGDSIKIEAAIDAGWHMTLIELNDSAIGEEYSGTYTLALFATMPATTVCVPPPRSGSIRPKP